MTIGQGYRVLMVVRLVAVDALAIWVPCGNFQNQRTRRKKSIIPTVKIPMPHSA
jgi:hypothetical protein